MFEVNEIGSVKELGSGREGERKMTLLGVKAVLQRALKKTTKEAI